MQSLKGLLIVFLISLTLGCAKNGMHYASLNGTDAVATQGLDGEQGYETLQRVNGKQQYATSNVFYFGLDDTRLTENDINFLQKQAKYLLNHPDSKIFLGGHTDERGSREYNIGLGERRASRVAEVLKFSGAQSRQIRTVSYGREKPQSWGHNEAAWRKNRRVELSYE